jgi:hypothetical protein
MDWIRNRASRSVSKLTSFRLTANEESDADVARDAGDPFASDGASAFSMSNPGGKVVVSHSYAAQKEVMDISELKSMMAVPPYFETRSGTYSAPTVKLQYGISKIGLILDPDTSIFEENIMYPNFVSLTPKGSRIHLRSSLGKDSALSTDRDLAWVAYVNSPVIPLRIDRWPENGVLNAVNVEFTVSFDKAQLLAALEYYKSTVIETDLRTFMNMFINLSANRISASCSTSGPVSIEYRTMTHQPPPEVLARLCLFYHEPLDVVLNDF